MYYEIAIPSYNRSSIIGEKSLALLEKSNVPKHRIKIFLRDEEQKTNYIEWVGNDYQYVLTGCNGILETRNFLRYYYHEEVNDEIDFVIFLDDDIEEFNVLADDCKGLNKVWNFEETLQYMAQTTKDLGFRLFGPSAYNNYFYLNDSVSTSLKYVIGAFCGLIIDKTKDLILTDIDHYEDFLFSIEHFIADNGVVRFNKYCIKTKYFEQVGGICESMGGLANRKIKMEENAYYMVDRYPNMCYIKKKKFGYDLGLNFRYVNE